MQKIFLCLMVGLIGACQDITIEQESSLQAIIRGEGIFAVDDIRDSMDPVLQQRLMAIGHLNGLCTAFHTGNGIVASAAHCFASEMKVEDPCLANEVRWPDGSRSQCIQIVGYEWDDERDMILFEVDPAPRESLEWVSNLEESEGAVVIGYPHQLPLSISHRCNVQDQIGRLFHDCDTLPGNSGSPVMDVLSGNVLAIHNGHHGEWNYATPVIGWSDMQRDFQRIRRLRQLSVAGQQLIFGPFGDLENRLIHHFPKTEQEWVQFELRFDVEDGYDYINIRDGRGVRHRLTGNQMKNFVLQTPVVITFESDYSGHSSMIQVVPI